MLAVILNEILDDARNSLYTQFCFMALGIIDSKIHKPLTPSC